MSSLRLGIAKTSNPVASTMVNTEFTSEQAVDPKAGYDSSKLRGKSVLITGGAHGIGEVSVRAFVAAGAFVTFGDVAEKLGTDLAAELGPDKVAFVKCDVTVWKEQLNLFKTALDKSPSKGVDIVFANAGIGRADEVLSAKVDEETGDPMEPNLLTAKVNMIGVMYTISLGLHYLARQPQGDDRDRLLLITASMSGYGDHPGAIQYSGSKYATRGIMKALRGYVPQHGARINIIAPWFIRTGIIDEKYDEILTKNNTPFAEIDDAAAAVLHIASDRTMNGRALAILPRAYPGNDKGYLDLQMDDYAEGDVFRNIRNISGRISL